MFEKLVKIFAFDRRPLNFGLKFELVWEPRRNLFGGLLNVLREADFHCNNAGKGGRARPDC